MATSVFIALFACGLFFLTGLFTGVWKYRQIAQSTEARAHRYVNIAHNSSFLYAFACLVLAKFAEQNSLPETIVIFSVSIQVAFFAFAVGTYIIHGILQDTDNQYKQPHQLGKKKLPTQLVSTATFLLIAAETGGFIILFYGFLRRFL